MRGSATTTRRNGIRSNQRRALATAVLGGTLDLIMAILDILKTGSSSLRALREGGEHEQLREPQPDVNATESREPVMPEAVENGDFLGALVTR